MKAFFKQILFILGFIWVLPVSILSWIFLLFLYFTKQIEHVQMRKDLTIIWDIENNHTFHKIMEGWYGFVLGCNIICVDVAPAVAHEQKLKHETGHCHQNYGLGILFFPVYILITLFIYLFQLDKHPYIDHPFERWARKYAGQPVDLPKEDHAEYMKDRNPWW